MSVASEGEFVTPGREVSGGDVGEGVAEVDGRLVATRVGQVKMVDGSVTVDSPNDGPRMPEMGDVIIGEVNRLQTKTAEVKILHIEGKPNRDLPAEQLFGDIFVAEVVDRFLPAPGDAMRTRDLIRAEVIQLKPVLRLSTKHKPRYGVLRAICPACGDILEPSDAVDDFNVACTRCDYTAYRALSDDYGAGFSEGEEGFSTLNRGGERWTPKAEARLSHDGARPYLSILADFRRGEKHEMPKEFLNSGGGDRGGRGGRGGDRPRREMTKTKCTLCGDNCEVPFKPTPGKPIRCRPCMDKVESGEADADDLAKERGVLIKARDNARETEGFKMFIGGLPFEATEDELSELFGEHGELKEVHIATDRETGKSRGFAFITYTDRKVGSAALVKLKGTKIGGRNLTIQESKPRDSGGRGRGGGRGGNRGGQGGNRGGGGRRERR
jgi:CxxC-x17-CxxC domain-containing protein